MAIGSCVGVAGGVFVNVGGGVAVPAARLQEVRENAAKPINNKNRLILISSIFCKRYYL